MPRPPKAPTVPPSVKAVAPFSDLKKDLRFLARNAPDDDSMVPMLARLNAYQMMEIERMAAQGLGLATIAIRLGYAADVWAALIQVNPEIENAYKAGAARGADIISEAGFTGARNGDASLIKYYLDRVVPEFKPKDSGPAVVVHTGPLVEIDQSAMAARFARQRALIDGTAEELDQTEERPA